MRVSMTLQNEHMRLTIEAESDWERYVLGMFAAGEERRADALIECKSKAHYTYGKIDTATITFSRVQRDE